MNIKRPVGHPKLNLSEAQIRYAMENAPTNMKAADWLRVDYSTYRRYAKMYIDAETGKNLFDLHRSLRAKKEHKRRFESGDPSLKSTKLNRFQVLATLDDIFAGKHPKYSRKKLMRRLFAEGIKPECCEHCGYNTKREFDFKSPLKLWYRDNDENNLALENLRVLCFNCFFLLSFTFDLAELHPPNFKKSSY